MTAIANGKPPVTEEATACAWLPFLRPGKPPLAYYVVDGTVRSSTEGSAWVKEWRSFGREVSGLVASPDGRCLVSRSGEGLTVVRLDDAADVRAARRVVVDEADLQLLAARYRPAGSFRDYSCVEVLLSTGSAAEIWILNEYGLQDKWAVSQPLRAGAGTNTGFVAVDAHAAMVKVASDSRDTQILTALGSGWVDVDAATGPRGPVFAGLRRVGPTTTASCAAVIDDLAADPRAGGDVEAVSVTRRLGREPGAGRSTQPCDDVWLVSRGDRTLLATRPPAAAPASPQPADARSRWDVFLSYSTTFTDVADEVYSQLEKLGLRVWYAPNQHVGPWVTQICEGLEESRSYVVVWGPGSDREAHETRDPAKRPFMQMLEIEYIVEHAMLYGRQVYVYALQGHPAAPAGLSRTQLIDQRRCDPAGFAAQVRTALDRWAARSDRNADNRRRPGAPDTSATG